MKITTQHPASKFGVPVILRDDGKVMAHSDGIKALRRTGSISVASLAALCNVSPRTVEGWEQGRSVPCAALNVMAGLLEK